MNGMKTEQKFPGPHQVMGDLLIWTSRNMNNLYIRMVGPAATFPTEAFFFGTSSMPRAFNSIQNIYMKCNFGNYFTRCLDITDQVAAQV